MGGFFYFKEVWFINIDNLSDKKIVIFGGLKNIKEIKNVLPDIELFDNLNRDITTVKNADLIVLNSDFISHSFTKKINSVTNKYNTKYQYICGTNIRKIIFSLNDFINK